VAGKLAVVLFNLGGPDRPESVKPFLFNLFNDPAIIGAPGLVRRILAKVISRRRAPVAREIYAQIGGKSPLLEQTREQAAALQEYLRQRHYDANVFVCMRYWHPMSAETAALVKEFAPDEIVLLPLYPQFSTTTTGSSLTEWKRAAGSLGLAVTHRAVCCYPAESGFVGAVARLIREKLSGVPSRQKQRVLFSAHGLPKKVIARGDPYQWQVEKTVAEVVGALDIEGLDYAVCYQSRVGPLAWIAPSLEEELERAARDRVSVLVVPAAFVSEHSETLVELDIEYRQKASDLGVPGYTRVSTVGTAGEFIAGLAGQVEDALSRGAETCPQGGNRICPGFFGQCPCRTQLQPEKSMEQR
jgi:ferrochelatase